MDRFRHQTDGNDCTKSSKCLRWVTPSTLGATYRVFKLHYMWRDLDLPKSCLTLPPHVKTLYLQKRSICTSDAFKHCLVCSFQWMKPFFSKLTRKCIFKHDKRSICNKFSVSPWKKRSICKCWLSNQVFCFNSHLWVINKPGNRLCTYPHDH